jgi:hypothetical protein
MRLVNDQAKWQLVQHLRDAPKPRVILDPPFIEEGECFTTPSGFTMTTHRAWNSVMERYVSEVARVRVESFGTAFDHPILVSKMLHQILPARRLLQGDMG